MGGAGEQGDGVEGLMANSDSGERRSMGEEFGNGALVGLSRQDEGGWSDFSMRLRWGVF